MTAMRWGRRIATGVVLVSLVAIGLGRGVGAQTGPAFSAQIQLALRALLAGDQTITGNWTCSGTCSGFGGGGGGTPAGPVNSVQFNDAGSFGGFGEWDGTSLSLPSGYFIATSAPGNAAVYSEVDSTGQFWSSVADETTPSFTFYNFVYDGPGQFRAMNNGDLHLEMPNVASTFQLGGRLGINDLSGQGGNAIDYGGGKFIVDADGALTSASRVFPANAGGTYTLAASGVLWKNAAGVETGRVWFGDPDPNNYNSQNTYIGQAAGESQPAINDASAGYYNTGVGAFALQSVGSGYSNSAFGYGSLRANTTGAFNSAFAVALGANTTGSANIGVGTFALDENVSGDNNVGIGYSAFAFNHTGNGNIGIGYFSGPLSGVDNLTNAIAIGTSAVVDASNIAVIGNSSLTDVYLGSKSGAANLTANQGIFNALKLTGSAGSKKVVCVDVATGQLYASSTGTDCSN